MSAIINEQSNVKTPPMVIQPESVYYPERDGKPMAETDTHREAMNDFIKTLQFRFENDEDVYVTGNIMFYYVEGDPKKVISPDVMFVRGIKKGNRRIYKLWEEKVPDVVIELSSRKTWKEDLQKKKLIYQELGVKEYYIHDPEYDYLKEPIIAFRLIDGELIRVDVVDDRVYSEALGLELVNTASGLRLFDPETQEFLLTPMEEHEARLHIEDKLTEEREARLHIEDKLTEEREARLKAEAELARLHEEIERLKNA
jgi:Uma2 family endonuclease